MAFSFASVWHHFKNVVQRIGSWVWKNFHSVTEATRFVADEIHSWKLPYISNAAHLISKGTRVADTVYDYVNELYGHSSSEPTDQQQANG
jgi:hypothetical protein